MEVWIVSLHRRLHRYLGIIRSPCKPTEQSVAEKPVTKRISQAENENQQMFPSPKHLCSCQSHATLGEIGTRFSVTHMQLTNQQIRVNWKTTVTWEPIFQTCCAVKYCDKIYMVACTRLNIVQQTASDSQNKQANYHLIWSWKRYPPKACYWGKAIESHPFKTNRQTVVSASNLLRRRTWFLCIILAQCITKINK